MGYVVVLRELGGRAVGVVAVFSPAQPVSSTCFTKRYSPAPSLSRITPCEGSYAPEIQVGHRWFASGSHRARGAVSPRSLAPPGRLVGVDVFFVISGFLITSVIGPEMLAGRFSVLTFYERRVRRLFPAFFTVMATCTALALVLFLPPDLRSFSDGLTATTIFGANLFFWKTANYFHSWRSRQASSL